MLVEFHGEIDVYDVVNTFLITMTKQKKKARSGGGNNAKSARGRQNADQFCAGAAFTLEQKVGLARVMVLHMEPSSTKDAAAVRAIMAAEPQLDVPLTVSVGHVCSFFLTRAAHRCQNNCV